jgi:hypothetical protein
VPVQEKGDPEGGNASRHYQRGTKYLDLDFSLSNYLRDCSIPRPLPILLYDIDSQSNGGGDFERAKPRLVQLHRERSFSRLGARLVGIGWPTLCFIVVY